jgi:hypothetical protein
MILGTVLKISSTIVVDGGLSADSATIEIFDPDGNDALTSSGDGVMDQDSSGGDVWYYIYQSDVSDTEGIYQYIVTAVSGSYEAKAWGSFELEAKPET